MYRVGLGSDIHRFETGRKLVLGGVEIPHSKGLLGHSDADVVLHSLCDALLGASALGDLGTFFPGDEKNKDRPSSEILSEVCRRVWDMGYQIINADIVIMAEKPKLTEYKELMKTKIAALMNVQPHCVGVKATTGEGMGAIGRSEGIFCQTVVLLKLRDNEQEITEV
ncbi:MAG: 2-C-methyl-D-erythritol 2,4-cyclodiphosphate synthase [Oligoflexia bacterium]|nr:2-C-methyl-D-erythritol 2,4-cyclodiphosphate synthase [Oligoflexia bacterium]